MPNPYEKKFIRSMVKFPFSVMIWGCFPSQFKPKLLFIDGIMKSQKYISTLSESIIPIVENNRGLIFQDDSATCHCSKMVKKFKIENAIHSLDWSGNSPDIF